MFPIIPDAGFCSLNDCRLAWAVASRLLRFWFMSPENRPLPVCESLRVGEEESPEEGPSTLFAGVETDPEPPLTADILPEDAVVKYIVLEGLLVGIERLVLGKPCRSIRGL